MSIKYQLLSMHFLVLTFFSSSAISQSAPSIGFLYNTKEAHSLAYDCSLKSKDVLECEFTQTRIRKKLGQAKLSSELENARVAFPELLKEMDNDCPASEYDLEIIEGKRQSDNEEMRTYIFSITPLERKDLRDGAKAYREACSKKTLESYMALKRTELDIENRTCIANSVRFNQTFGLVQDGATSTKTWVVKSEPAGPCGMVQLSRFELEKKNKDNYKEWSYVAKKVITNKHGQLMPGMMCTDLDETEYIYSPKSRKHALGCDYIEFEPL